MVSKNEKALNYQEYVDRLKEFLGSEIPLELNELEDLFNVVVPEKFKENPLTYRDLMILQQVLKSCAGDSKATQEILDRLLGKPTQYQENLVLQASYVDFLDSLPDDDGDTGGQAVESKAIQLPPEEPDILDDLELLS